MSKKATKSNKEHPTYQLRDIVLGKVRGYPPWPAMVVDPDNVPSNVSKERPTAKKSPFYCVRFFPTGEFAWLTPQDISKLQRHEIQSYIEEPYRRSGDLLKGYQIALDPKKWEEDQAQLKQNEEEEVNDEVDQLESENDEDDSKKSKTKKRKRESESAPSSTKAKKAPKGKKEATESTKKAGSVRAKKNGTKPKATVESEDEGDHAEAEGEEEESPMGKKPSPPPAKKVKRDKEEENDDAGLANDPEAIKVREWRHRLQKTFLSTKSLPKEEDMPALDQLFTTVENYDKINIQYLSFSKIGKVMRHIAVLVPEKVPRDAEYNFRERARALVEKWHQILNANKPNGTENAAPGSSDYPNAGAKEDAVTSATAALDLNGQTNESISHAGDLSAADITMSEA